MGMGRHDRIDITRAEEHPCPQNAPYEENDNTYDPQIGKEEMGICEGGTVEPLSRKHRDYVVRHPEDHHGKETQQKGMDRCHNKGIYRNTVNRYESFGGQEI